MLRLRNLLILMVIMVFLRGYSQNPRVIELSWEELSGLALEENLSLKMSLLDEAHQNLEVKRAWGGFLPSLDYQWAWSEDELNKITMPFDNVFIHNLSLSYPLFTGGARYANLRMQQHLRKSLSEELRGTKDAVVMQSLQAYYGVILSSKLVDVYAEARFLAEANLEMVESQKGTGAVTDLALMQARTRYFEILPQLEKAKNDRKLAFRQLKLLLNIAECDSLYISDELELRDFLGGYKNLNLEEFGKLAETNSFEVHQIYSQRKAIEQQRLMAASQYLPQVVFTAGASHYAYSDEWWLKGEEFERYNSLGMAIQLPLFRGGSRYIDYKEAGIAQRKMQFLEELTHDRVRLEAEQAYYSYQETKSNLKSYREALSTAAESLRLANLYYEENLITQTEVLGAQLAYTQNKAAQASGIYDYNISQLNLLRAIGDMQSIWEK
jgi:outer membrane protein TolC